MTCSMGTELFDIKMATLLKETFKMEINMAKVF